MHIIVDTKRIPSFFTTLFETCHIIADTKRVPFSPHSSFSPTLLYIKTHSQTLVESRRKGPYATTSSQLGSTPISGQSVSKLVSYSLHIPANSSYVPISLLHSLLNE